MGRPLNPNGFLGAFERLEHDGRSAWRRNVIPKAYADNRHITGDRHTLGHIHLVEIIETPRPFWKPVAMVASVFSATHIAEPRNHHPRLGNAGRKRRTPHRLKRTLAATCDKQVFAVPFRTRFQVVDRPESPQSHAAKVARVRALVLLRIKPVAKSIALDVLPQFHIVSVLAAEFIAVRTDIEIDGIRR